MYEVWKEFKFDCAHTLDGGPRGDGRYTRLHGHSYQAEVWLRGARTSHGWVIDLGALDLRLADIAKKLDHSFLTEIEALGAPTMENIASFIWNDLSDISALFKVTVRRDSLNEGCSYYGPGPSSERLSHGLTENCDKEMAHA